LAERRPARSPSPPWIGRGKLDAARAEVDQAASLAEAIWRIVGATASTEDIAVAQQAAQILMHTAPFASSIARSRINPVGPVPVSRASSDPLANNQASYQVLYLNRRGIAIAAQLDRVRERFDPAESDLTNVFAHDAIGSASKTSMLVHAFQHFWNGQDNAAVHLALPRVEDLLRELDRVAGPDEPETRAALRDVAAAIEARDWPPE
jgi:hypothetical protein